MAKLESNAGEEKHPESEVISFCSHVWFSVWAGVELEMPQHVEVYLGNMVIVPCYYTFKDLDHEPTHVVIEWFVKSKPTKHDNASSPVSRDKLI